MSELGASIIAASGFLRSFFSDVSKLLTVVEGEMTGSGLISPFGTGSFWNRSSSYAFPSLWIPNYVARQYVEAPPEGAKVSNVAGWYAFVVVHFAPQAVGEPSVIWGTATLKSVQYVWTSLNKLALAERGPKFLNRIPVEDWQILPDPVKTCVSCATVRERWSTSATSDGAAGSRSAPTRTRGEGQGGIARCISWAAFEKMRCGAVCCTR